MNRLQGRMIRLEQAEEQATDQPYWWQLPEDQWHLGRIGLTHEEALTVLDELDAEDAGGSA